MRAFLPCALAMLGVAAIGAMVASAEIYRWRDAEGREHFTTDLSRVPPAERGRAAGADATKPGSGSLNFHSGDARRQPEPESTQPAPANRPDAADRECENVRKQAARKLKQLRRQERKVEYRENLAGEIGESIYTERRRQIAFEKARAELEELREEYEGFRRYHYKRGVAQGCTR